MIMTMMALESPRVPKRNPAGRACSIQLGVAAVVAAALLVVPFLPERSAVRR